MNNLRTSICSPRAASAALFLGLAVTTAPAHGQPTPPAAPPTTAPARVPPADLMPAKMVIDRAIEAAGGSDAIRKITQIKYTVTANSQGADTKMSLRSAGPMKVRVTAETPGGTVEMGRIGNVAWQNTGTGFILVPESRIGQVSQLDLYGLIITLGDRVEEFVTVDRLTFNGLESNKVQLADEPSGKTYGYFDNKSGAILGLDQTQTTPMGPMSLTTTFSDTKQISPLTLFTKATMVAGGMPLATLTFSEVEFNPADDYEITVPPEVQKQLDDRKTATSLPAGPGTTLAGKGTAKGKPTTQPAGAPADSPQLRQGLAAIQKMDDVGRLKMMASLIEAQIAQVSEEEKAQMQFLADKIRERIAELDG